MKTTVKFKFLIFLVCFIAYSFHAVANDTIRMITRCAGITANGIVATAGKQFTVNFGDGSAIQTFTGTGNSQSLSHLFPYNPGRYEITISASEGCFFPVFHSDRADTMDLSKCSSIINYYTSGSTLRSLNTNNCTNLEYISVSINRLTVLDLRDNIALKNLYCSENQLTRIDLVAVNHLDCIENRLPLSNLYTLSNMISNPYNKYLGRQEFPSQRIAMGDSVDFSDQATFGGIATVFVVEKNGAPAPPDDYKVKDGIITFYNSGFYRVIMTNAAVISHPGWPAVVVAPFHVINFVPFTELIDLPTTATAGIYLQLTGTVIPHNATYKDISWKVKDAGTTGATIGTGSSRLYTTAPGTVMVTATVKDGSAIGTDYMQDFYVEVEPLSIAETPLTALQVYPNPTTGELRVTSYKLRVWRFLMFMAEMSDQNSPPIYWRGGSRRLTGWFWTPLICRPASVS